MSINVVPNPPELPRTRFPQFGLKRLLMWPLYVGLALALIKWLGLAEFIILAMFAAPLLVCFRRPNPDLAVLKCSVLYGIMSMLSLPFLNSLWFGEIPVVTVVQVPKITFAIWLRNVMVMDLMTPLGLSRGSFSPDWTAARPYALAVAYLVPLTILLAVVWRRTRFAPPIRVWIWMLLLVAFADFLMTLRFANGPGLTIY
jgi:hypothetical protein